ncbi:homoserine O-succinyltransferase [Skermanella stibiiresistens SB22]|uniref:Homoserine O-succinyltransferase n=1 Tax=Skermanella stibiiresistens SB22 TaxID=1385369 RepID=W9GZR8_9PROT|nr:antitoxin MazE family protein [Skermanella stibiiresistens]EWY39425.1 homoserine O-succinyltransferase [Skermanella stibiiresistens SB22]
MAGASGAKSSRMQVRRHRERLREQVLRPIQIWVPDVRASSFNMEAHRQSLAVAASDHKREDQAFIDTVSVVDLGECGDE